MTVSPTCRRENTGVAVGAAFIHPGFNASVQLQLGRPGLKNSFRLIVYKLRVDEHRSIAALATSAGSLIPMEAAIITAEAIRN